MATCSFVRDTDIPTLQLPNKQIRILAFGALTNQTFSLVHEHHFQPVSSARTWYEQDVIVYLLEGRAAVIRSAVRDSLDITGDVAYIPKLTSFRLAIVEPDTKLLIFYTPAGPENIDMLLGTPSRDKSPSPSESPDFAKTHKALAQRFGMHTLDDDQPHPTTPSSHTSQQLTLQPQPFKTSASTAPRFWVQPSIPELWTILLSARQTNNSFTLTEIAFARGHAAGPLKYLYHDESYYILSGHASIFCTSRTEKVGAGDFVFIPRGTVFGVDTESDDFVALTLHTPSGIIEGALPLLGAVEAAERRLPREGDIPPREAPPSPADVEQLLARMRVLGIENIKLNQSSQ